MSAGYQIHLLHELLQADGEGEAWLVLSMLWCEGGVLVISSSPSLSFWYEMVLRLEGPLWSQLDAPLRGALELSPFRFPDFLWKSLPRNGKWYLLSMLFTSCGNTDLNFAFWLTLNNFALDISCYFFFLGCYIIGVPEFSRCMIFVFGDSAVRVAPKFLTFFLSAFDRVIKSNNNNNVIYLSFSL